MQHTTPNNLSKPHKLYWFFLIGIIGPAILFILKAFPKLDVLAESPTTHFWIVLIPAAIAAIIAFVILSISRQRNDNRTFLIGLAFIFLSSIFALHAISTPGVIFKTEYLHVTAWSTPIAFFTCAIVLALSTNTRIVLSAPISKHQNGVIIGSVLLVLLYIGFMFAYVPGVTGLSQTMLQRGPTIFVFISWLTVGLYIWTAAVYLQQWVAHPTTPLATLVSGSILLAQATIAAQYGGLWQLSFWLYHVLLFLAITIISYSALVGYERTGSLSSIVEGWLLSSTLERQQQGFRNGMQALLLALDKGDIESFTRSRVSLGERFGLASDQLDMLEEAVTVVAQDREQERRLQAIADIGRSTTIERNPDELMSNVLTTLHNTTHSIMTAIGLINESDQTITFNASHRLIHGQPSRQTIKAPLADLPLQWFHSTDLPYQDLLPNTLTLLTPEAEQTVIQVPLQHGTDLIGVLMFQPAQTSDSLISERMESVLQSIAAHISAALINQRLYTDIHNEHTQLQASEIYRDQLTQMIVHDLKNPLTAIMSYLEILKRDELEESQVEMVNGALRSSRMMVGLVSDLLNAARLQEGQMELRKEAISGQTLLYSSITDMEAWAKQDRKTIVLAVEQEEWEMCVDINLLQRVLINLISNAIKHTPSHTEIEVGAQANDTGVELWIKDSGPGIAPELLPHLFERFKTGSNNQKQNSTGLGLYFCKLAVEAHGGTIEVTNNQGSTFTIHLPAEVLLQPQTV